MADTVTTNVVFNGTRHYVLHITNESDGTGEAAVVKVDLSTLTGPDGTAPTRSSIIDIDYDVSGFNYVTLAWDHTTNDVAMVLKGSGFVDFSEAGGLVDPASNGGTGDLILTTDGSLDGASYDIRIKLRLKD